jgi:hypothetical protein
MTNWKSIVGSPLAVVAVLTVAGSTLDDPRAQPQSIVQIVFAAATFLSVIILHWLLWRFIIPSRSGAPPEVTSFFPPRSRRGFFTGTIAFGYVQVAMYCINLTGYLLRPDPAGRVGFLVMSLFLICLGIAARLRNAFSTLSACNELNKGHAHSVNEGQCKRLFH